MSHSRLGRVLADAGLEVKAIYAVNYLPDFASRLHRAPPWLPLEAQAGPGAGSLVAINQFVVARRVARHTSRPRGWGQTW